MCKNSLKDGVNRIPDLSSSTLSGPDQIRIIHVFQREQTTALLNILENTDPGGKRTTAVSKAGDLVHAFLGAPVLVDAADLGAPAHPFPVYITHMRRDSIGIVRLNE